MWVDGHEGENVELARSVPVVIMNIRRRARCTFTIALVACIELGPPATALRARADVHALSPLVARLYG